MQQSKGVYALIPARGGSKAVKKKNLQKIAGKSLLQITIEQALACKEIDRVYVSTDCPEIKAAALQFGALVPFLRPAEFSGDLSPDIEAFLHWLDYLDSQKEALPETVVHLRVTSPFRTMSNITDALHILRSHPEADSVRSVTVPSENPFKMWRVGENGYLSPLVDSQISEPYNLPRQALPPVWWHSGTIDVIRTRVLREQKSMTGRCILPLVVSAREALDINKPADLRYAEFLLESRN